VTPNPISTDITGAYSPTTEDATAFSSSPSPPPDAETIGSRIGHYVIIEQLGEGGMGSVYLAEQEHPVRRPVALKVIKPGMDSAQVVARFQAELQALALMDHENIAKVLDAGATDSGRPYFVMELVRGVPITRYCDENRLTTRQRLELFATVCQAVHHAHQKGIIHRDIKPSNVLVATVDGKPVAKVIDFGLAKATEKQLSDTAQSTQCGTIVGTLEYMSPEQAEMSPQGVDTRTDVYSLGILLYELLTGTTPLDWGTLRQSGFIHMLRMIREADPPRPSSRLSGSATLAEIAALRRSNPQKLPRLMRRELDWIVLKSLEKDRNRRYDSANSFAQDIRRYLADEPVEACPPSLGYRLRKFTRRYRNLIAMGLVALIALISGLIVSVWQAVRATAAEQQALAASARAIQARADASRADFLRLTEQRRQLLNDGVGRAVETLVAMAAAFETWPNLTRDEFRSFVSRCTEWNPEITSVTWVPRVRGADRAAVEAAVRAEGFANFQFRDLDPDGTFSGTRAADRDEHFPIVYVEPLEPNRVILGLDSSGNPPRRMTLDQARDTGRMVASAPLLLGEEKAGQMGFLLFKPVYHGPRGTEAERRESLRGFVTAAFRINDLVDRVLGNLARRDVAITIYDGESGEMPIYRSPIPSSVAEAGLTATQYLEVAGRRWRLEFTALTEPVAP
jgi:serine/threonine protein kinase/CHASE1-domain containing sensor protein